MAPAVATGLPPTAFPAGTDARARLYGLFSTLTASPSDTVDPRTFAGLARELEAAAITVPGLEVAALVEALDACALPERAEAARQAYAALFEVGTLGPPLAIRGEHAPGAWPDSKEEVVRFYEHFGYALAEGTAWAPDHLSVMLEFMHLLAFLEQSAGGVERESLALAENDFVERHLARWVTELAVRVDEAAGAGLYREVFAALADFVTNDFAFLAARRAALRPLEE